LPELLGPWGALLGRPRDQALAVCRHLFRIMWLAGCRRTPDMERAAERAAERLGLPLEIIAAPGALDPALSYLLP